MLSFGERLYILLKEKGITQKQLAKEIGVTSNTISKYVTKGDPKKEIVVKIADYLGVSYNDLMEDK